MYYKPTYNPQIHHRRSIRLKGHDYSQAGLYFITICCENRKYRFGKIKNEKMILNEYGTIAYNEWIKLTERFSNFELDVFQIMPNHMHAIIALNTVGAGFNPVHNKPQNNIVGAGFNPVHNKPQNNIVGAGCIPVHNNVENNTVGAGFNPVQNNPQNNTVGAGFNPVQNNPQNNIVGAGFNPVQNNPQNNIVGAGFNPVHNNPQNNTVGAGFNPVHNNPQNNIVGAGFNPVHNNVENNTVGAGFNPVHNNVEKHHKIYGQSSNGQPHGLPIHLTDNDNWATARVAPTIGDIIGAYKSLVANECLKIWKTKWVGANPAPIMGKLWQTNYYEHIIRNQQSYHNISEYIVNNPAKWQKDKFYK